MVSRERVAGPSVVAISGLRTLVGSGLAERLASRAPALRVVALGEARPDSLDEQVAFLPIDPTDRHGDHRIAEHLEREGVEVLVLAAHEDEPSRGAEPGAAVSWQLMKACASAKLRRLVVASSTMLYGPRADNPGYLTEEHPLRGHPGAQGIADQIEMERLLGAWSERRPDVEVTVLRSCWTVGPGVSNRLTRHLSLPVVPVPLGYDPLLQLVHPEDLLDAFEQATLGSHPGVFNVVGSGVLPLSTLLRLAGSRALALPAKLLHRLAFRAGGEGEPPEAFLDYLRYGWVADGRRGWDAFGEPAYSTKEAWMSFVSSRRMQRYR